MEECISLDCVDTGCECDDTHMTCNVPPEGLIQAEQCHTKDPECCVEREREDPRGENMTSMCVGNGHAGEGNDSTRRGNSSLGLMGHWRSLSFSSGKGL